LNNKKKVRKKIRKICQFFFFMFSNKFNWKNIQKSQGMKNEWRMFSENQLKFWLRIILSSMSILEGSNQKKYPFFCFEKTQKPLLSRSIIFLIFLEKCWNQKTQISKQKSLKNCKIVSTKILKEMKSTLRVPNWTF